MNNDPAVDDVLNELRRIGLDPDELDGLAVDAGAGDELLRHLRSLPPGSSWSAVFPDLPRGSSPSTQRDEDALGLFDYPEPPRGVAVFASLESSHPQRDGEAVIAHARRLGIPLYGAGVVLDRGHPHLYLVLTLDATEEDAEVIANAIRELGPVRNAFPIRTSGTS